MQNRRQQRTHVDTEFRSNKQGKTHKGKTQPDYFSIRYQFFSRDTKYNERSIEWVNSLKSEQAVAWISLVATTNANTELTFPSIESTLKHWIKLGLPSSGLTLQVSFSHNLLQVSPTLSLKFKFFFHNAHAVVEGEKTRDTYIGGATNSCHRGG